MVGGPPTGWGQEEAASRPACRAGSKEAQSPSSRLPFLSSFVKAVSFCEENKLVSERLGLRSCISTKETQRDMARKTSKLSLKTNRCGACNGCLNSADKLTCDVCKYCKDSIRLGGPFK